MPRAFIMFHTRGLNTGKVRLDTLMTGFCCACTPGAKFKVSAAAHVNTAANPRRDILAMTFPLAYFEQRSCASACSKASATLLRFRLRANNWTLVSGGRDAAYHRARRDAALLRGSRAGHAGRLRAGICGGLPHLGAPDAAFLALAPLCHLQPARLSAIRYSKR